MVISSFRGDFAFLSNLYMKAPFKYGALEWPSAEHAYQAAKCKSINDMLQVQKIKTAMEARKFGVRLEARSDWEQVKDKVMFDILWYKFYPGSTLLEDLKTTDPYTLVNGAEEDNYWGTVEGLGLNKLGKTLMFIRDLSLGN